MGDSSYSPNSPPRPDLSGMEETVEDYQTSFSPFSNRSDLSNMEETVEDYPTSFSSTPNKPDLSGMEEEFIDEGAFIKPIEWFRERDVEESWGGTFTAAVLDGIQNSLIGSGVRLLEAGTGGLIPGYITFPDSPSLTVEEAEKPGFNPFEPSGPTWLDAKFQFTYEKLGLTEKEWDARSIGERSALIHAKTTEEIDDQYNPNKLSATYIITNIAAMLGTDLPLFRLLPLSPVRATLTGMGYGGVFSALHQYSSEGQVTPLRTAAGIGLGGVGGKAVQVLHRRKVVDNAKKFKDAFNHEMDQASLQSQGRRFPSNIFQDIKKEFGISDDLFDTILKVADTGKLPKQVGKTMGASVDPLKMKGMGISKEEGGLLQRKMIPSLADQAARTQARQLSGARSMYPVQDVQMLSKARQRVSKVQEKHLEQTVLPGSRTKTGEGFDDVFEPIKEGIRRYNPGLEFKMLHLMREELQYIEAFKRQADPFLRKLEGGLLPGQRVLSRDDSAELGFMMQTAWTKGDLRVIENFIVNKIGSDKRGAAFLKDYRTFRDALERIFKLRAAAAKEAGQKLGYIPGYTPRYISDPKGAEKWMLKDSKVAKAFQQALREAEDDVGKLSDLDRAQVLQRFLTRQFTTVGSAKQRLVRDLSKEDLLQNYMGVRDSTNQYINESFKEINRHKFFGKHYKEKSMDQTIKSFAAAHSGSKNPVELRDLLKHVYIWGPKSMNVALKAVKNLGYVSLLAHPVNAIRQFSDLSLSAYINGVDNTVNATKMILTGQGLTAKEQGLVGRYTYELISGEYKRLDKITGKITDVGLRGSGFAAVDSLGKGSVATGAILKLANQMKSLKGVEEVRKEWGVALGDKAMTQLIADAKKFNKGGEFFNSVTGERSKYSPLLRDIAFAKTAKIQPITILNMPKWALRNPNWRFLLMLKSFTLQQINLWRQSVFKELRYGNRGKGIQNATKLATFFTLGNMGIDKVSDLMLGRDRDAEELFILNLYRHIGLVDKYDIDRFGESKPVSQIWNLAVPPLDPLAEGVWESWRVGINILEGRAPLDNSKWDKIAKPIPIIGRFLDAWGYKLDLPPTKKDYLPTEEEYKRSHSLVPRFVQEGLIDPASNLIERQKDYFGENPPPKPLMLRLAEEKRREEKR